MNEGDTLQNEGVLRELLVSALDGDATDAELRQLNDALRSDESLRRSAHRFLSDDALLADEIGTLDEATNILRNSAGRLGDQGFSQPEQLLPQRHAVVNSASRKRLAKGDSASVANNGWRSIFSFVNQHGFAVAALALFALAAIGWHHLRLLSEFERLHSLAAAPDSAEEKQASIKSQRAGLMPSSTSVARATAVVDCEWFNRSAALKFGDELSPGQKIRLKKGLLQLTFATGAKVVVEGPADFVATTATEAILTEGKIAAAVPRFARGYTILTPTAEIVDLGTEFGVNVDQKGDSEVHVFDGDVVARPRANGVAQGELLHAQQDEAIQFAATKGGQRISADSSKFVRRLTPGRPANELPLLPVTHDLALWLAADVMPIKEPETPVTTWPDILVGDNQFPDDAWQFNERVSPKWVRDAQGLPAVRFDGWSTFLATSPMATGDRQTVFVVFAPGPASFATESHGAMLLKYGVNTPSMELALLPDFSPRAWIWASNNDGSTTNVGVLRAPQVKPHVPCAVGYTYDALTDRSEMSLNGQEVASGTAPKSLEQQARKYIGAHAQPWMETYFLGNMYEILVYDTALDEADRGRVFEYLSKRYGFSLTEP